MDGSSKKNNRAVAIFLGCLTVVILEKRFHLGNIAIVAGIAAGIIAYFVLNQMHK